jgi:hypothetical protein
MKIQPVGVIADVLTLLAMKNTESIKPGDTLALTLYWQVGEEPSTAC